MWWSNVCIFKSRKRESEFLILGPNRPDFEKKKKMELVNSN